MQKVFCAGVIFLIANYSLAQVRIQNFEFIEVHTDRDLYLSGDQLFYKIYLGNIAGDKTNVSTIAYIELVDACGNVLLRNKHKCVEGTSYGNIQIPIGVNGGQYQLRAYTLWMLNFGEQLFFKKGIVILDETADIKLFRPTNEIKSGSNLIKSVSLIKDSLQIHLKENFIGEVGLAYRETILRTYSAISPVTLIKLYVGDIKLDSADLFFSDKQAAKSFKYPISLYSKSQVPRLDLNINRTTLKPRDQFALEIALFDADGNRIKGNVSVSIANEENKVLHNFLATTSTPESLTYKPSNSAYSFDKEYYVSPRNKKSLAPVDWLALSVPCNSGSYSDDVLSSRLGEYLSFKRKIETSYGGDQRKINYTPTYLSYDNMYYMRDYEMITSLEDFFFELVPELKVNKKKQTIWVRNTENRENVYTYKNPPLILVDGCIYENAADVLRLSPSLVESVSLTWKTSTINKMSLPNLADDGVLSIHTKPGAKKDALNPLAVGDCIYKEYALSGSFESSDSRLVEKERPDFASPLYWNPDVNIEGKKRIQFMTSDELGKFVVEVKGITNEGQIITQSLEFEVKNNF